MLVHGSTLAFPDRLRWPVLGSSLNADLHRSADVPEADAATLALVVRARAGDREAFADLYRRFAAIVHGLALSHAGPAEASDLVQDVFLSALRALPELDQAERFGPWLCAMARNRALDRMRERARRPRLLPEAEEPSDETRLERSADRAEEAEVALAAVRSLPEAYRETLMLRLVEGLDGPTIAARLGMTSGSVRVNLCRGMKRLRERLARGGRS
jgi:RNA polymerase sigma-70 factor (ECF subfamily)